MFTLLGARQRFCDGIDRRNFIKIGAFGAGAVERAGALLVVFGMRPVTSVNANGASAVE